MSKYKYEFFVSTRYAGSTRREEVDLIDQFLMREEELKRRVFNENFKSTIGNYFNKKS